MSIDEMEHDVTEVTTEPDERPWRRSRLQWVLLVVALAVAISGLVSWRSAVGDDTIAFAESRDTVLITARQHIETLNTLDYREVDKGLKAWAGVTTGVLRDQLTQVDKENRALLADQKKISSGKVIDAAVVDLDDSTATVIAAVEITVKDEADEEPTVKRNRFSADLVKVKGEWKLENLQQVAVSLS